MVYLYAALGMVMLSGIMAIFEMGLSLTGQSMIPTPQDEYLSDASMKAIDIQLLGIIDDEGFPDSVLSQGLCGALEEIYPAGWNLIGEGRWANSCQSSRGLHRVIVRKNLESRQMPYQLFSCALSGQNNLCAFELE